MFRKLTLTFVVFTVAALLVFGASKAASPDEVTLPEPITALSACPPTGCASGTCHGFDNVPEPDGIHEMSCPRVSCADTDCHAWGTLATRYHQPSDMSLNLWIVVPVLLVVGLVLLVRKL